MDKTNTKKTLQMASKMDKLEKKIAYLTSYIDVLKHHDEIKREKKLNKWLEDQKEGLLAYEVRTLSKETYHPVSYTHLTLPTKRIV